MVEPSASRWRGIFLVLDGLDGNGKTTQVARLSRWLTERGESVVLARDPGSTPAGDEIRRLLLDVRSDIGMPCETLLYLASRAQLVQEIIEPALAGGHVVLCDRFSLATLAYQGYGGGQDVQAIRELDRFATRGHTPDWTGILHLPAEVAASRRSGTADRIEQRDLEYFERVQYGFLMEAHGDPLRVSIIDAHRDADAVTGDIIREVSRVLAAIGRP